MLTIGNRKLALLLVVVWCVFGLAYVAYVASSQRLAIEQTLQQETTILHRIVSQRVDQHDAHLTNLSALAIAGEQPQRDLFLQVAGAIRQFYPRITAFDLVSLSPDKTLLTTRASRESEIDSSALRSAIHAAATASTGKLVLLASPLSAGRYLIVKRSPNSEQARFGLALEVDARALLESAQTYLEKPMANIALSLPDGTALTEQQFTPLTGGNAITRPLQVNKNLGSRSQPLLLETRFEPGWGDVLPARSIILGLGLLAGILVAVALVIRLLSRIRSAELRARLGEQDARIAHALRINALGEIASGMAHELTQPLTAILSQSHAGVRLVSRADTSLETIEQILQANVTQAKRAAGILWRLREWTWATPSAPSLQQLNQCMDNVVMLLAADARQQQINISVRPDSANPVVMGDAVEIEQVIFNLVRNAMEAMARDKRSGHRIQLSSLVSGQYARVLVADNGPGISSEIYGRLFEPFVTSKAK